MSVDLSSIRSFVVIAELGSFQDAADVLNISAPALTRRIQKLEADLGIELLTRTTRRVEVTIPGRQFLPKARKLLEDFDDSVASIKEFSNQRSGRITVACVPTATHVFIPNAIKEFNRQFPNVRVRIVEANASQVVDRVSRQEADVGITFLGGRDTDLVSQDIYKDPYVLVCRHDHPLAASKQIAWRDLEPYRIVTASRLSGSRLIIDLALKKSDWKPNWFYEVQHFGTSLGIVEAGLAVVALPELVFLNKEHALLTSRRLVKPQIKRTIRIVKRRTPTLSRAADAFFEIIGDASLIRAVRRPAA